MANRVLLTTPSVDRVTGHPVALYVHFPFCLSVCPYCDFVVYAGRAARGATNELERLVAALVTEIELRGRPAVLESVYLGGGTPSLMSPAQVARVLGAADRTFGIASGAEVTLEINPGTLDRGDLAGFRAAGVNRLSIGAQSFAADELRRLGRRHSAQDVGAAVVQARQAGFGDVSLDLLYDVPGQTLASWQASLDAALALEPDHISAYALTLDATDQGGSDHLPPSRGATQWRARALAEQDEDRAAEMYELADDVLARAGLGWYEISNWARPGRASRHNLAYWHSRAWEAVGPGAHRFDGLATRSWNAAPLDGYLAALEQRQLPPGDEEAADDVEWAILRLRTADGVELAGLDATAAEWGLTNGLLERQVDRLRLTRRGRLLSNEMFGRLLER